MMIADTSPIPFSLFDKGVTVFVLGCGAYAAYVITRRWLAYMDELEKRDQKHLQTIEELHKDHHAQLLTAHEARVKHDQETISVLDTMSQSLRLINERLSNR